MQGKVTSELSFCLAENGFSLDELVIKLADLFEHKAMSEFLKLILQLVQEVLMSRIFSGKTSMTCCNDGKLQLNGGYDRRIRTSVGEFTMNLWRVRCSVCGKTFSPLKRFVQLEDYQTKTNELEKLVVETVSETSYRRAVAQLDRDGKFAVSYRTAHNWVIRTDCDELDISKDIIGSLPVQIMPDGTKFKGEGQNGKARQGDIKVVIGINTNGDVFPLGSWAGKTWEYINEQWKQGQVALPKGSILVSDGELGLSDSFVEYVDEVQRCHWHIKRDLYHAMHQDGGTIKEAKPLQDALAGALAIELPENDFECVSEQEKSDIEERMENTERVIDKLVEYLDGHGYPVAATYIRRAKRGMFGYIRRWLKWGLISPRASSMVERVMRELARRIKKIAYGWSDKGVTKVARIILKRFTNAKEWEEYWMNKMNIVGNVYIDIGNYKVFSQNFAH